VTVDIGQDLKFVYNLDDTYESNFDRWLRWSNRERNLYKQELLDSKSKRNFQTTIWRCLMDELPRAILDVISDYENNPQSRQPEKVIYKIKEIIMKNQIDLKLIRESGL
tara:strand:- start:323 stop:649 length:327 start_codon:yes stop_codon:yes gene_type:complete